MIDLILLMLINSLAIVGIYLSFGKEMIFFRLGLWVEKNIHYDLTKPLFNCPTCMASVHSVIPFWMTYELSYQTVLLYIIYVPALSAISTLVAKQLGEE
jgi:hypothetical protein